MPGTELPDGWEQTTLGDVCKRGGGSVQTGPFGAQLHAHEYTETGIPTVMPVNIGDNRIIAEGIARVPEAKAIELSRHRMEPGDIVYSRRGDVERRALVREAERGWLCGTGSLRVRLGDGIADPLYMSMWLGHPTTRAWIVQHAVGATMPNLNAGILGEVPVVLPPLPEQRAIAEVLGALDDKIESNRRIGVGVEQLLSAHAERVMLSEDQVPLSTLTIYSRELVDPAKLGLDVVDHFSIPAFDAAQMPEHVPASSIMSGKFAVREPAILLSRLNPSTPRTWFAKPEQRFALCSTEFLVLRPKPGGSLGAIWLAVVSPILQEQLERRATGTSFSHQRVRPDDALASLVPDVSNVPTALVDECDALLARMNQARVESRNLATLRDSLLPEVLSGRLRVKDAEQVVEAAA